MAPIAPIAPSLVTPPPVAPPLAFEPPDPPEPETVPFRDIFALQNAKPLPAAPAPSEDIEALLPLVTPQARPPQTAPVEIRPTPVLVDVTPRALVVETAGGWCDVVVQRNAKIPCDRTRAFTTSNDGQTLVRVRVAQGEDPVFGHNTFLGQVELVGLRAAPRGEVTIQVRFEVDESGTLNVYATDVSTGREAHALLQLVGIAGAQSVEAMQAKHAALRVG
jgi:molecular chaperone DnaK